MAWGIKRTPIDKTVSDLVRYRDNWTCQRCFRQYAPPTASLQCSHYKSRKNLATRHDPDNCDALCAGCHTYFGSEAAEYRAWKVKRMGERAVTVLEYRARHPFKITKAEMELLHKELKQQMEKAKADYINRAGRPKDHHAAQQKSFLDNVNDEPF